MQAAGYTLDLYCDNNTDGDCPFHFRQGTHAEFVADGKNCRAECYREARKAGWKMKRNGEDYCPTCAKKLFKPKWYEREEKPKPTASPELMKALKILMK